MSCTKVLLALFVVGISLAVIIMGFVEPELFALGIFANVDVGLGGPLEVTFKTGTPFSVESANSTLISRMSNCKKT